MINKDELTGDLWFGKQLFQGERGGKYYLNEAGNKVYVNENRLNRKQKSKPRRTFKPRPGAFQRYLNHQQEPQ